MTGQYIGIDSGTQGVKAAVLCEEQGGIIAESFCSHDIMEGDSGRREQEPGWWTAALAAALSELVAKPGVDASRVKALGVSGQQHGFVPLDKHGQVIRPAKLWCDTETEAEAEELTAKLGGHQGAIAKMGNSVAVGFTASKVTWLKKHEPENYGRLAFILLPHDYLNYWLTGNMAMEYGDASGTAFFDVRKRIWCDEVLNAMDSSGKLKSCLPRLLRSHQAVGSIKPDIARQFGFPEGALVSAGGGDNMMAAIGTGNVSTGVVTASLGTSGTIYATADKPVVDPKGELAGFCGSSGLWLPLVCTMNVTVSTELTRKVLGRDIQEFSRLAESAPLGSQGIMLTPFFNGERTPALPSAFASFSGITSSNFTPANMCRAAMEGPTLGLRYGLEVMQNQGVAPKEIRLIGGGARNPLWRRMVAAVFGLPVICPEITEAGALGAAIQAMHCHRHATGIGGDIQELTRRYVRLDEKSRIEPEAKEADAYTEIYSRYLRTVKVMSQLY
jgi:xylulokinase